MGPGRIASSLVGDFSVVEDAEVVAVASRSLERAQQFADRHEIPRAYGSYAELIAADDVDVLYVATPHPQHHQVALAAIDTGKALLVEKAFTATVPGAQQVIDRARERRTFLMEAMWTRFQPTIVRARELIASGEIGEVRQVQADLGVDKPFDPTNRLFDPAQGGGALLDLGVYVVSFAQHFLGTPQRVVVSGSLAPTGVDAEAGLLLGYDDGKAAALVISLRNPTPGAARIIGTKGWIDVHPRFHHSERITVVRTGADPEDLRLPHLGRGYAHELIEVTDAVRRGDTESRVMPLSDTLAVQRVLNAACEQLGVVHHEDASVLA